MDVGGVDIELFAIRGLLLGKGRFAGGLVVDDGDTACVFIAQGEIDNAFKYVAANVGRKWFFGGKDFVLVAKALEVFKVLKAGIVGFFAAAFWEGREVGGDGTVEALLIFIGETKLGEFALGVAFEQGVTKRALLGEGVFILRHRWVGKILQGEHARACFIGGERREGPFVVWFKGMKAHAVCVSLLVWKRWL